MADVHHALRQSAVNLLSESVLHDQQPNAMTPCIINGNAARQTGGNLPQICTQTLSLSEPCT